MTVRVLIVDDQAAFREAARLVVQETAGFVVAGEAASGEEAVDRAGLGADLVLMDVKLPGIDGIEATRRIVVDGGPVVFLLSTYEDDDYAARAVECGAAAFIPKSRLAPETLATAWSASDPRAPGRPR